MANLLPRAFRLHHFDEIKVHQHCKAPSYVVLAASCCQLKRILIACHESVRNRAGGVENLMLQKLSVGEESLGVRPMRAQVMLNRVGELHFLQADERRPWVTGLFGRFRRFGRFTAGIGGVIEGVIVVIRVPIRVLLIGAVVTLAVPRIQKAKMLSQFQQGRFLLLCYGVAGT